MAPSSRTMRRSMRRARSRSWVTATTVFLPWSTRSRRIWNTCWLEAEFERPGGLVGEDHRGIVGERARHRHALALAAGQLVGPLLHMLGETEGGEQRSRPVAHGMLAQFAQRLHGQHHVLQRRELRQQEVELEHEAQGGEPRGGALRLVHVRGGAAADLHLARRRQIEQAEEVEQRRLARARRPGDGHELVGADGEVDVVHQRHRHDAGEDAPHTVGDDQWLAPCAARHIVRGGLSLAHIRPRAMSATITLPPG